MDHPSTLELLLDTTEKLVAEVGCQNTTIQEIIRRAGLSKGAIYHYVKSKDELFGLILQAHMDTKIDEHMARNQHSVMTFKHNFSKKTFDPLSVIVKGLLQPANEKQVVLRRSFIYLLSRQEQPDVAKILTKLHQTWINFTAGWIKTCQNGGSIAPHIDPYQTASLIISILFGLMVQKSITENSGNESENPLDTSTVLQLLSKILDWEK